VSRVYLDIYRIYLVNNATRSDLGRNETRQNNRGGALSPMTSKNPKILFVYFSFTNQTHKVVEAMSEVLRAKGCKVSHARIEFTDPRYGNIF
jgi:hypothetical protein